MAPMINCPSAPMFQLFERKQTERPTAIRISGAALIASSCSDQTSLSGSTKKL
ncbi:hypothetical protein D3C86_2139170 [compost metagenome]